MTNSENSKILKNALILYGRLLFTLAISLYVSRLVLQGLGVESFGIYNLVFSVVALFGFLSATLSNTTQRFISSEIVREGSTTQSIRTLFSMSINLHLILSVLIYLIVEVFGIWLIEHKLLIPKNKVDAALLIFHMSAFIAFINVLTLPFNALIISYEKFSVIAWLSIIEVLFKLFAAIMINIQSDLDNLLLYAFLVTLSTLLVKLYTILYCFFHIKNVRYKIVWETRIFNSLAKFSGWNIFGAVSYILMTQGTNIVLNLFFGPVINASRGIATQVQGSIQQFSTSLQSVFNPQIFKTYTSNNKERMHNLMYISIKYSYFVLLLFILPLVLETEFILSIWLTELPNYTVEFVKLMLLSLLLDILSSSLIVGVQATGRLSYYQMTVGGLLICNLPVTYLLLEFGAEPYVSVYVYIVIAILALIVRLVFLQKLIELVIMDYFRKVLVKITNVTFISVLIPCYLYLNMDDGAWRFLSVCLVCFLSIPCIVFFFGADGKERTFLRAKIIDLLNRGKNI